MIINDGPINVGETPTSCFCASVPEQGTLTSATAKSSVAARRTKRTSGRTLPPKKQRSGV